MNLKIKVVLVVLVVEARRNDTRGNLGGGIVLRLDNLVIVPWLE